MEANRSDFRHASYSKAAGLKNMDLTGIFIVIRLYLEVRFLEYYPGKDICMDIECIGMKNSIQRRRMRDIIFKR